MRSELSDPSKFYENNHHKQLMTDLTRNYVIRFTDDQGNTSEFSMPVFEEAYRQFKADGGRNENGDPLPEKPDFNDKETKDMFKAVALSFFMGVCGDNAPLTKAFTSLIHQGGLPRILVWPYVRRGVEGFPNMRDPSLPTDAELALLATHHMENDRGSINITKQGDEYYIRTSAAKVLQDGRQHAYRAVKLETMAVLSPNDLDPNGVPVAAVLDVKREELPDPKPIIASMPANLD